MRKLLSLYCKQPSPFNLRLVCGRLLLSHISENILEYTRRSVIRSWLHISAFFHICTLHLQIAVSRQLLKEEFKQSMNIHKYRMVDELGL